MAYQTKTELSSEKTYSLGGVDKSTGKKNPTSVEGYYIGSRVTKDTGYGPGLLHFFQTPTGNHGVWGKTRLNNLLSPDLVGQMVLATFTGMSPPRKGKNPSYLYKVQHDPSNFIEVANDATEPQAITEDGDDGHQGDEPQGETDPADEPEQMDVAPPPRPVAPRAPAQAPSPDRQAKVQALLNRAKSPQNKSA